MVRFSHKYHKLPDGIKSARLFAVERIKLECQTKAFIDYDVTFEGGRYQLPEAGDFLLLCFIADTGAFFTTCRPWDAEKEAYYRGLVGKTQSVYGVV